MTPERRRGDCSTSTLAEARVRVRAGDGRSRGGRGGAESVERASWCAGSSCERPGTSRPHVLRVPGDRASSSAVPSCPARDFQSPRTPRDGRARRVRRGAPVRRAGLVRSFLYYNGFDVVAVPGSARASVVVVESTYSTFSYRSPSEARGPRTPRSASTRPSAFSAIEGSSPARACLRGKQRPGCRTPRPAVSLRIGASEE